MKTRSPAAGIDVGRYTLYEEIAWGGMGSVHFARLHGAAGFSRIVAIKRLNPRLGDDPELVAMFLDEARLAARVRHPNVVPTLDVVDAGGEILIVMEYVHGESLARLAQLSSERGQRIPPSIASSIMAGALHGLHAAHEATDERGEPLGIVHRDVSPQNLLVGADGIARVVDFGIAKAAGRLATTSEGHIKGKLGYITPEHVMGETLDRRADVYSAGVVLWEMLTGARLFRGESDASVVAKVLLGSVEAPGAEVRDLPPALDGVTLRALSRHAADRFASAREMAEALLAGCPPASPHEVADWVEACAHESLSMRRARVTELESGSRMDARGPALVASPDPPSSQISNPSITLPGSEQERPRRGRRRLILPLAGAAVMTAAIAVLGARSWRARADHAHVPPPPPAAALSSDLPQAAPSTTMAAPSAAPATAEGIALPLGAPPQASAPKRRPAARASEVGAMHQTPPRPRLDCDPPYVRAPDGRKLWKRECLGRPE